jgi:hypothetical protein
LLLTVTPVCASNAVRRLGQRQQPGEVLGFALVADLHDHVGAPVVAYLEHHALRVLVDRCAAAEEAAAGLGAGHHDQQH